MGVGRRADENLQALCAGRLAGHLLGRFVPELADIGDHHIAPSTGQPAGPV